MGDLKSCGCERDGVGGREVRDDSQGVGVWRHPFLTWGACGERQVGKRMAAVWRVVVNCKN